jgi:hypothetical protein
VCPLSGLTRPPHQDFAAALSPAAVKTYSTGYEHWKTVTSAVTGMQSVPEDLMTPKV